MTETIHPVPELAFSLAVGAAFGAAYFAHLWRAVRDLSAERGTGRMLLGFAFRLATAAGALAFAAHAGAEVAHLLAAAVGFAVSRQIWIRLAPGER